MSQSDVEAEIDLTKVDLSQYVLAQAECEPCQLQYYILLHREVGLGEHTCPKCNGALLVTAFWRDGHWVLRKDMS